MIKTLQRKFVFTSMLAVSVLLLLLLGAINLVNILIVGNQVDRTLEMIAAHRGDPGNFLPELADAPGDELGPRPPQISMREPKSEYDTFMSSNFFLVQFDRGGRVVYVDASRTSIVTEAEAAALAADVYEKRQARGKAGRYRFCMTDNPDGSGASVVFLDTYREIVSYVRVLLLSGGAGLIFWGLMLLLVMLLSKRAIQPIAESMEKQKQFVTNAGHEIKTPLAIIQSNTEAMELYQGESKWSRNIKEQTLRLSGLMQNLLLLSRMDEGILQGKAAGFSLDQLLESTLQGFLQPLEAKGISLKTEIWPELFVYADPAHVEQVLSILLDNAIKYTNAGGRLEIAAWRKDSQTCLRLENTCEELPAAPPDKLFDRFYRADAARTQKGGGYGIGLSAARALLEVNRGSIRAQYKEPNKVCFLVRFS